MSGPLTPPVGTRFSTGEDLALLDGPTTAPAAAVVVTPGGEGLDVATDSNPAATTFYLLAGTHVLGGEGPASTHRVIPKAGNTYIGAPGAVLDGRNVNQWAFGQQAPDVTITHLEVIRFVAPINNFVVNHDGGPNWHIAYCNIHDNKGAGLGLGSDSVVEYTWLHDNSQYGFSSFKYALDGGLTSAIVNILIDHCEINNNGTNSDEYASNGTPLRRGRNGAGKFWDTDGITVTNNWVHHSNHVSIWADTNNINTLVEGNLIEDSFGEGFYYEISYNFVVRDNTFRRNAIGKGKNWASRNQRFPIAAVYISESGGDPAVSAQYATSVIEHNTFLDNWGDIVLWENADRFCNSPANTSHKIYKPRGSGASLAICNRPVEKTLTVSTTAGSADFTVTAGTFEATDEGRPVTGAGIPTGATILVPTRTSDPRGYVSATAGRFSVAATETATGVVIALTAGSIDVDPAYTVCRWHTQNIRIQNNTFDHDSEAVRDGMVLGSGIATGRMGIFSNWGTFPDWSPYHDDAIQQAITFGQNNKWLNNTYRGNYSWMPFDTATVKTFPQWQAAPYNQDLGSTFDPNPPSEPPPPPPPPPGDDLDVWANTGGGPVEALAIHAVTATGQRVEVIGRS